MASSVDSLVANLSRDKITETMKVFKDKIDLVSRKGPYPYDYMDSIIEFNETELPPKAWFYSKPNDCDISDEDYEHAHNVWKELKMKTTSDYHEFRNMCLKNYGLDSVWYFSTPGLACDGALQVKNLELKL